MLTARLLLRSVAVGAAVLTLSAAPLLAQSGSGGKKNEKVVLSPPTPPVGKSDVPWTPYGVAVILGLLIIGVNFIPSKRGHQD